MMNRIANDWRLKGARYRLEARRCAHCGAISFPAHAICAHCGCPTDGRAEHRRAPRAQALETPRPVGALVTG